MTSRAVSAAGRRCALSLSWECPTALMEAAGSRNSGVAAFPGCGCRAQRSSPPPGSVLRAAAGGPLRGGPAPRRPAPAPAGLARPGGGGSRESPTGATGPTGPTSGAERGWGDSGASSRMWPRRPRVLQVCRTSRLQPTLPLRENRGPAAAGRAPAPSQWLPWGVPEGAGAEHRIPGIPLRRGGRERAFPARRQLPRGRAAGPTAPPSPP